MIKALLPLVLFLFSLLSLPQAGGKFLRSFAISAVAPSWNFFQKKSKTLHSDESFLQLENQMLRSEIEKLKKLLSAGEALQQELQELLSLEKQSHNPFFERRKQYLMQILSRQLQALPARVIFREPISWSSSVWLNVGERDNQALGKVIVEKNSPVVVGRAIVGVVEEVEQTRCRIRLLTDEKLSLAVCAFRGGGQNRILAKQLTELIQTFSARKDLAGSKEMNRILTAYLETLDVEKQGLYLARGEIHGVNRALWQSQNHCVKGVGFLLSSEEEKLIQKGDLLVTTGLDGIFPPDLHVAIVTKVFPMREGAPTYSLEAKPIACDFNTLNEVFVLPRNF